MIPAETDLPIETVVPEVRQSLQDVGVAVLTAEPGAGKTTIVPLRLLDEPWAATGTILVLEPRRVAARSVARRMAQLLGESVGDTVGWRTRDDVKVSDRTRVEVITEGILTRRLQNDPSLPGVAGVIFDEFHERSVHADLGLALALEAREAMRPDLRLLVMSATIDADAVAELVGGEQPAPVIDCAGRTHPIDVRWRPRGQKERLEPAVVAAVGEALEQPGDVLVFLPGMAEIRRSVDALGGRFPDVAVLPLYGALSAQEQDEALRGIGGRRRVVVSTDVAETSLTVEGIGSVVDSGLARRPRYDPATGLSKLVTINNSRASADQRAGRAGRLGPGVAVRLWSKMEHAARSRHEQPEILQIDLASVLLEAMAWGVTGPAELRILDQPKQAAVDDAREVLEMLGAIDDGHLTADGRRMLRLPLHPRLAAMVSAVGDGPLGWPASVLAALMTERDVLRGRPSERPTDLWPRVQLVADQHAGHIDADNSAVRTARRVARDIARRAGVAESAIAPDDLGRCLALAYPDRIAQKRAGQGGRFRLRNGMGAEVDKSDPIAHEDMLVVAEVSGDKRNVRIRRAAGIDPLDIELGFASDMDERTFFGWDDGRDDLLERVERRLGSLDFGTHERPAEPSERTTEALIERIAHTNLDVLSWTDSARNLQRRVALVAEHRPELVDHDIDDATLTASAATIFGPYLIGATSRRDLEALDVGSILRDRLGWNVVKEVDRLAPASYELPRGRQVAIDYMAATPRVSVRAQDAFGISQTPTLVDGAVPLTFELLSPASRPIQITSDLAAFWEGSWAEVRKDMAGRYPKHDWPERPQSPG